MDEVISGEGEERVVGGAEGGEERVECARVTLLDRSLLIDGQNDGEIASLPLGWARACLSSIAACSQERHHATFSGFFLPSQGWSQEGHHVSYE